jgi:hypothetical protein
MFLVARACLETTAVEAATETEEVVAQLLHRVMTGAEETGGARMRQALLALCQERRQSMRRLS